MSQQFNLETSLKYKIKRFFLCAIAPCIKFSIFSSAIFYIKANLATLLMEYFNLTTEKTKASLLLEHLKRVGNEVSLLSPKGFTTYLSSATNAVLAEAKVTYIEKIISVSTLFVNGILTLVWFYLIYKLIFSIIGAYHEKERQNELANLVVQKMLPVLKENLNKKLDN